MAFRILDGRDLWRARLDEPPMSLAQWIEYRRAHSHLHRGRTLPAPVDGIADAAPVVAFVDTVLAPGGYATRWIARCECGSAEYVDPTDLRFWCTECCNRVHGGAFRPVVFPSPREAAAITRKMASLPPADRRFRPDLGERLAALAMGG